MAIFQAPYSPGRIDIPDERADRYRDAGWREVKAQPEKKAPAKRSAAKKSE